jgi:peptidoglycan/LPS O-acetylase OafA/YrhL
MQQIKYFDNINILSGFAALSVLIYHLVDPNKWPEFPNSGLLLWFRYGWIAVDLFFVISGFVIALSFLQRAKNSANLTEQSSFRKKFLFTRLARIIPLYILTCLIWVVFVNPNLIFDHLLKNFFLHLFFLHNLIPEYFFGFNPPSWTLAVEVQFYLLLAIFGTRLLRVRILHVAFLGILIAILARSIIFFEFDHANYDQLIQRLSNILCYLDEFIIGLILAKFVISSGFDKLIQISVFKKLFIATILVGVIYLSQIFYIEYVALDYKIIFYRTILGFNCASIILIFCMIEIKGLARKMLSPLYYLGTISYGIYLWHCPIMVSLERLYPMPQTYFMALCIFVTIIFSSLSWHFLEKPIIEKVRNKSSNLL